MGPKMTPEEVEIKAKELVDIGVYPSVFQARKAVLDGKYEKYKTIAMRNIMEMSSVKNGATVWPCPKCKGFLIKRKNKMTKETFLACTNYPTCKYTQKDDIIEKDPVGIKDAAEVWE